MNDMLRELIKKNSRIKQAFLFSGMAHCGQYRKSGLPYITHPVEVASMLLQYGYYDEDMIIAALLHDVAEDTAVKIEEIRAAFGDVVAFLVDGVTKEDSRPYTDKLVNYAAFDKRIAVIKAVDRIHNLYTLKYLPLTKQRRILSETKAFYVTFAKDFVDNPGILSTLNELVA